MGHRCAPRALDPEITFLPLTGTRVESGGYVGHDGVRAYFAEVAEIWSELQPRADDTRTTGDHVVVLGGCAVRGKGSGVESDDPMAWVLTVRDGKVTSHRGYRKREEALAAVGADRVGAPRPRGEGSGDMRGDGATRQCRDIPAGRRRDQPR